MAMGAVHSESGAADYGWRCAQRATSGDSTPVILPTCCVVILLMVCGYGQHLHISGYWFSADYFPTGTRHASLRCIGLLAQVMARSNLIASLATRFSLIRLYVWPIG
ncbi:hypothetical protein D8779_10415 [Pseudomonas leptonychotis]|uniref:Uncharacterized protein n=1 Tax=Pseudomonas leptonychotis TaxID=2448482 RepID=A0A4T2A1Y7_9PSED|nr:hypothetical protein D8779_10415 [Pseudomonas leptonychotis]